VRVSSVYPVLMELTIPEVSVALLFSKEEEDISGTVSTAVLEDQVRLPTAICTDWETPQTTTPQPNPGRVHLPTQGFKGYRHNARRAAHFTAGLRGVWRGSSSTDVRIHLLIRPIRGFSYVL
jgi:hypothetical protein